MGKKEKGSKEEIAVASHIDKQIAKLEKLIQVLKDKK